MEVSSDVPNTIEAGRESSAIGDNQERNLTEIDNWVECSTSEDETYYYNKSTGVTTWDSPYPGRLCVTFTFEP